MNHEMVQLLLNGYIDGELDVENSLAIETHMQGCAACSSLYRELSVLQHAARNPRLSYPAPPGLARRIHTSLNPTNRMTRKLPVLQWRWIAPAAVATLLLFLVLVGLGRGWFLPNQEVLLAQEVQSAHVRSLMANHLTDVASTDQHTVKPWFDGKLDFSPPVVDPSAQGFPLIGGRLDYLNGRPVAALIYQRNKHYINLFIWPVQNVSPGSKVSTLNGYNLVHWDQSGMTFWAVSDVSQADLQSFVELIQKNIK